MIGVMNESPAYWEKILSESDLSADKEEPQVVEITVEDFKELSNLELLAEEDYRREDDPVIQFNGITKDSDRLNADHSGLRETNEELRTKIGSDETFFEGHRIIKPKRGNRACPVWAATNDGIQRLLLNAFPKLATNEKQRVSAGRWARVIQLYFKSQMSKKQVADEMGLGFITVRDIIRAITRVSKGMRADGRGAKVRNMLPIRHPM